MGMFDFTDRVALSPEVLPDLEKEWLSPGKTKLQYRSDRKKG